MNREFFCTHEGIVGY